MIALLTHVYMVAVLMVWIVLLVLVMLDMKETLVVLVSNLQTACGGLIEMITQLVDNYFNGYIESGGWFQLDI